MARTRNYADVIRAKIASNPDLAALVEEESFKSDVAMLVSEARNEAGLTQKQLAERISTHQSVISRIEDADYDGHSLGMLRRIGSALGKTLRIKFDDDPVPSGKKITETFSVKDWQPAEWSGELIRQEWIHVALRQETKIPRLNP